MAAIGNGAAFAKGCDFCCMAWPGAEANVDGRSDDPRSHLSRMRCTDRKLTPTAFAMLLRRVAIADNRVK